MFGGSVLRILEGRPVQNAGVAAMTGHPVARPPLILEVSWEVCSQSGGIYTVLRSKCSSGIETCDDDYCLVGPYREFAAKVEFEPDAPVEPIAQAAEELRSRGLQVHCGRWVVSGRPRVVLIDITPIRAHLEKMKYYLWRDLGIGTPGDDPETDDIIAFGYAVADLLTAVHGHLGGRAMLAQFHEWQGAVAVPLLRHRNAPIPTVFTTHATLVGRSVSASEEEHFGYLNGEAVADEHGIGHRFRIERAAAKSADVFTTVSDITAREAEYYLGRRPDVILPNGLNLERFAAPHEFQNLHQQCKKLIHEFVMGHFFPSYTFDLDHTLYIFTAGRYEYRNKGIDVFVQSLYELNKQLKAKPTGMTVVAFIVAPAPFHWLNVETLNRQAMFNELRDTCESIREALGRRLFLAVAGGRLPTTEDLLDDDARIRLQRMIHAWKRSLLPTIVTHDLKDDVNDPILCHLRRCNLLNARDDPVKVVFHPQFITSTSPVLGMEYDQFVRGCNLGVFPSYYEPWGYTPMECIVRGIPAVTSDLSGFGAYVKRHFPDHNANGLYIARRQGICFDDIVQQITDWLYSVASMSLRERIQLRNRVENYAEFFDWRKMACHYRTARRTAIGKHHLNADTIFPEVAGAE